MQELLKEIFDIYVTIIGIKGTKKSDFIITENHHTKLRDVGKTTSKRKSLCSDTIQQY